MSTIAGVRTVSVEAYVPTWGSWEADVTADTTIAIAGRVVLTVGNLSLVGDVDPETGGFDSPGRWRGRVVGGIGWGRPLPDHPGDQSDSGIPLANVLRSLATDAGETLATPIPSGTLGSWWGRPAGATGAEALAALVSLAVIAPWWIEPATGLTRFGNRGSLLPVTVRAEPLRRNLSRPMREIGMDMPAAFLPGEVVDGTVIGRSIFHEDAGQLKVEVWNV